MAIVELDEAHLPDAARLFAAGYGRLRLGVPALPGSYLDSSTTVAPLRRLLAAGSSGWGVPAMAAIRDGKLAGYMASLAVPDLRGSGTAAYVPEWAHAAAGPDRAETFAALYGALSARWVDRGWLVHCCSILADDRELRDELAWLGFGLFVVDALRGIDGAEPAAPVVVPAGATIGQAAADDLDELLELELASEAYYAGAPVFLHRDPDDDPRGALAIRLTSPEQSIWIGRSGPASRIASFIYLRPPTEDVCRLVRDPGTVSICGAYTIPEARGRGLARALLAAVVAWAGESGYDRVGVDFESANLLARRFWLRSFEPVCLYFERHLDDRFGKTSAGVKL